MGINHVEQIDDRVAVRRVLISVSDKSGLAELVPGLLAANPRVRFFSTGGTYRHIADILAERAAGCLTRVAEYTGQPETQGGLVKTLDFKIYLGLLTETYNDAHQADLARTGAVPIDLVVVNLYPFEKTIARPDVSVEAARGNIDIGGPCMIRAAAKNFLRVAPLVDPSDYAGLLSCLQENEGCTTLSLRFGLAQKAFGHTAAYDTAIAEYLQGQASAAVRGCYPVIR